MRSLTVEIESFPLRGTFVIARGSRTEAVVVTVWLEQDGARGWGECTPYQHYGESPKSVVAQIESVRGALEGGADRQALIELLEAGAARNGVDAALWDLECRAGGKSASELAGLGDASAVRTVRTLSIASPEEMAREAAQLRQFEVLKLKLDGADDLCRVEAVREAARGVQLVVDANESWQPSSVEEMLGKLSLLGVRLVEQPVAPADEDVLLGMERAVPVCADESFHTLADLDRMTGRYDMVNLKLDKTGGLTHALEAQRAARERGLGVMVGCMLGTSLAMAPGLLLAQDADFVDLDGPLLLAADRDQVLEYGKGGLVRGNPALWGG